MSKRTTEEIIERVDTIKRLIDHLKKTYKKNIFISDMVKSVIIHEAEEVYDFIPNDIEIGWIIHTLKK